MVASNSKKMFFGRRTRIVIFVALLILALLIYMENNVSQMLLDKSYADAYAAAVEVLNGAVFKIMQTGITYEDLMTVTYDASGRITLLQANTVRMNALATEVALHAQEMLKNQDSRVVKIPLGAAFGSGIFSGMGPKVSVQIVPVGAVATKFSTDFESAGINQTRHRIMLTLAATIRLVIPTASQKVEVSSQLPVAESIIVGEVPDSFVDVNNKDALLNLLP